MKGAGDMRYVVEAQIEAELPFDLRFQIESTLPTAYEITHCAYQDDSLFMRVRVDYGTGAAGAKDRNARNKLAGELIKQVGIYGGYVRTHICYDEENLPCVVEDLTGQRDGGKHGGSYKRVIKILEREGWY